MNKSKLLVFLTLLLLLCLAGCKEEKREKKEQITDKVVGMWLQWDDSQEFNADQYVKKTYIANDNMQKINNRKQRFIYSPQENGLYVFNYIIYDKQEKILDRITIASSALFVNETVYENDNISNTVCIYKASNFPKEVRCYDIVENKQGQINISKNSVIVYDTVKQTTKPRQFKKDGYSIDIVFEDIEELQNVVVKELDKNYEQIKETKITKYTEKTDFYIDKKTKHIEVNENYKVDHNYIYTENYKYDINIDKGYKQEHICMFSEEDGLVYPLKIKFIK